MQTIRLFEAFAGYGSQLMALLRLEQAFPALIKVEPIGISEIDKYALAAYQAVHGEVKNYGDISQIDWAQVPDFDLFTYSSPCQDFSVAGLQRGGTKGSGTRSSLLWECERAIAAKRPKYLLFENVAALVSAKFVKLFNQWQLLLESYGYTNFTQVLNAKDYGVPQNRERVFMVSILDCDKPYYFPQPIPLTKRLRDVLEDNVPEEFYLSERMLKGFEQHNANHEAKGTGFIFKPKDGSDTANALRANGALSATDNTIKVVAQYMHPNNPAGTLTTAHEPKVIEPINAQDGCARTIKAQYAQTSNANLKRDDSFGATGATDGFRVRKLTPKECFRLMGVADTDADKMIAVLSKSRCYQVAGNSIVVDVLAAIFSQLFIGNNNKNQQTELF